MVSEESATLNAGYEGKSMKSVTSPRRMRSKRLPAAPPSIIPIATGAIGWSNGGDRGERENAAKPMPAHTTTENGWARRKPETAPPVGTLQRGTSPSAVGHGTPLL